MKIVKSLMLGSAAGLFAMSGAQAADLPLKAKAVEYVRICSLYGAGFFYIPGTDTCIKLGDYLRAEVAANTNSVYTGNTSGAGAAMNRYTNGYTWRSREDLNIDTRTAWFAPSSMRPSPGRRTAMLATPLHPVRRFTRPSVAVLSLPSQLRQRFCRQERHCKSLRARHRTTLTLARSPTVRSVSTTPSSSSLASRWVRPFRSSALPGPTIPATPTTVSSVVAARSPA